MKNQISVIIPTLNEKNNITILINKLLDISNIEEIIVVDDNSDDGTGETVKKFTNINHKVKLYYNIGPKNLFQSVLIAFDNATFSNCLVMDADLQHSPNDIIKIITKFFTNDLDLLIGSRFKENKIGNISYIRTKISIYFIKFMNIFLSEKYSDPLSGFFILKKEIIIKNKKNYFNKGFKILFDILYLNSDELKVDEIQISFLKRVHGKSKFNYKIVMIFLFQLFRIIFFRRLILKR